MNTRDECDRAAIFLVVKRKRRFKMPDRLPEVTQMQMGGPDQVMNDVLGRPIEATLQKRRGELEATRRFGSDQMVVEQPAERSDRLMISLIEESACARQSGHDLR